MKKYPKQLELFDPTPYISSKEINASEDIELDRREEKTETVKNEYIQLELDLFPQQSESDSS